MIARRIFIWFFTLISFGTFSQLKVEEVRSTPQAFDSIKSYKNRNLIVPIVALSTETSWIFGVADAYIFKTSKKDSTLRSSFISSGFLYTLKDQILIAVGTNIFLPKEKYIIRFENTFSKFPDKFWGIGNDTPESTEENYTFTQFYINPAISRKVSKDFFLGLGIEYQSVFDIQYESGGNFEKDKVVGIYNETEYSVFGLSALATYDSRNHAFTPTHGSLFRAKFSNFNRNMASDYEFQSFELDIRKFIQIRKENILAIQAFALFTSGEVPYRHLALLGGNMMMRGYYGGRFRDKMFIGTQAEYRFPVYWRFGAVVFGSAGEVADNTSQFSFSKLHYAAGGGIRFSVLPKERLNLRFDVAYGNRVGYYISLFESF